MRNVSFEVGADGGLTNNYAGAAVKGITAGFQFAFELPYKGHFDVSPLLYKQWIYSGLVGPWTGIKPGVPDGTLDFNLTWAVEANYYMALGFLPDTIPLAISGRMLIIGTGGRGYTLGQLPTNLLPPSATQFYTEPIRLTLDASKILWGEKYSHAVDVWVAYQYRQNVLGADHSLNRGCQGGACTVSTVYTGISVRF